MGRRVPLLASLPLTSCQLRTGQAAEYLTFPESKENCLSKVLHQGARSEDVKEWRGSGPGTPLQLKFSSYTPFKITAYLQPGATNASPFAIVAGGAVVLPPLFSAVHGPVDND